MRPAEVPYLRVASELRRRISDGELRPGEQVPSVTKIADEFGVSRSTARRALDMLKSEGLTDAIPGWGTFVAGRPDSE